MMSTRLAELRAAVAAAGTDEDRLAAMLRLAHELEEVDPRESLEVASAGLELAQRVDGDRQLPQAFYRVAWAHRHLGNYQDALDRLLKARELFEQRDDTAGVVDAMLSVGQVYSSLGRDAEAAEQYAQALEVSRSNGLRHGVINALVYLGIVTKLLDPVRALEYFESALEMARLDGEEDHVYSCLVGIGHISYRRGDRADALRHYQQALTIAEAAGSNRRIADCCQKIGDTCLDEGEFASALEHFQRSLDLSTSSGDRSTEAFALGGIGGVYHLLGDDSLARDYYRRAITIWEGLNQRHLVALFQTNLGHALERCGELDEALEHYQSAFSWMQEHGPRQNMSICLGDIGDIHAHHGRFVEAMSHYEAALAIAQEFDDGAGIANWTGSIGRVLVNREYVGYDPERGEELLLRAIELASTSGQRPTLPDLHSSLSMLYRGEGKWEAAHQQTVLFYEVKEELRSVEAHLKLQQMEHRQQMAELERQRIIEETRAAAAAEVLRMKAEQVERELGNTTLQLLAQTELLRDLRNDLLKIARRIPPSEPAARELRERIKRLPCESVDWEKFDVQFRAVHPEFIRRLTERATDLTPTEVRICTMLRMNLKSHEIASIFCISEDGVDFHRRNIRRKLQLRREEKLPLVLGAM